MAPQTPCRCRQPRGSRRTPVHLHPPASRTMEERAHHQRDRAAARGVQATDNANRANRCNVVLGLLASGQINMRKVDGWKRSPKNLSLSQLTSPPETLSSNSRSLRYYYWV